MKEYYYPGVVYLPWPQVVVVQCEKDYVIVPTHKLKELLGD